MPFFRFGLVNPPKYTSSAGSRNPAAPWAVTFCPHALQTLLFSFSAAPHFVQYGTTHHPPTVLTFQYMFSIRQDSIIEVPVFMISPS
jgi:hypothetical protein